MTQSVLRVSHMTCTWEACTCPPSSSRVTTLCQGLPPSSRDYTMPRVPLNPLWWHYAKGFFHPSIPCTTLCQGLPRLILCDYTMPRAFPASSSATFTNFSPVIIVCLVNVQSKLLHFHFRSQACLSSETKSVWHQYAFLIFITATLDSHTVVWEFQMLWHSCCKCRMFRPRVFQPRMFRPRSFWPWMFQPRKVSPMDVLAT